MHIVQYNACVTCTSSKNALGCRYSPGYTGRTYRKPPVGLRGKVTEESGKGVDMKGEQCD